MTDFSHPDSSCYRDVTRWPIRLLLVLLFLLGALAVAWGAGYLFPPEANADLKHRVTALWLGIGFLLTSFLALALQNRVERPLVDSMTGLADSVDRLYGPARDRELLIASALGLFLEVLLIRWQATELLVASYFKNVTLLAAFLGLGLGFAATGKRRMSLAIAPLLLAVQVIVISIIDWRGADRLIRHPSSAHEWIWDVAPAEWNWDVGAEQLRYWLQFAVFYGFFAALFISTILIFIPIGQITGRLMRGLPPIRAYTFNILGSLVGVVLFGLVSYLWLPPIVWFGVASLMFIFLLRHERLGVTIAGLALLTLGMILVGPSRLDTLDLYSPYQRLEVRPLYAGNEKGESLSIGVEISANKAYHLRAANLSDEFVAAHGKRFPRIQTVAKVYGLPYEYIGKLPNGDFSRAQSVLIVGAGAGNDVAAALRANVARVDAVEIDPAIYQLGRTHHPESPYLDKRVTVHINDARAFMRQAPDESYDLAVFGLLDSHTLLSGMSAVRLDNFVYTRQSIAEARRLLKPNGTLALSFAAGEGGYLATRLHNIIADVFQRKPVCFNMSGYDAGLMYIVGKSDLSPAEIPAADARIHALPLSPDVEPSTDDWPFLYLQGRRWDQIPRSYFIMVAMLAFISAAWVLFGSGRRTGFSPHFFFLGGAFLLIEVKGITELALVFGTTWVVSSVVIAAILTLILFSNLFVTLFPNQHRGIHYALLALCLLAGYAFPLDSLLSLGFWPAAILATLLLLVPLFFAGVIFATSLRQADSLPRVFSSNLLGAILGGLCEYSSMALGFRNMYLIGLALYALSFLTMPRKRSDSAAPTDDPRVDLPELAAGASA